MITLAAILALFIQRYTHEGFFGVLMAVQQLFIGKVVDSLDKMYIKTMKVQTDALLIRHRVVRVVKIHDQYRKNIREYADRDQRMFHIENTIQHVAVGIVADIHAFMHEIKLLELVKSSIMWKSPKISSFLDAEVLDVCVSELRDELDAVK